MIDNSKVFQSLYHRMYFIIKGNCIVIAIGSFRIENVDYVALVQDRRSQGSQCPGRTF